MSLGSSSPLTSLILPAFNPGAGLETTLARLAEFRVAAAEAWEIILVNDGSTDGSASRMEQWARTQGPAVRVLHFEHNHGKGHAVKAGLLAARGQFRLFTDIDLAYEFSDIRRVAQTLWSGKPVAIADRSLSGSRLVIPAPLVGYAALRHLQSTLFHHFTRFLLQLPMGDTQAGLKGLRADVVADVVPYLECKGFAFDCELLAACARRGWPVASVPVTVRLESRQSTVRLQHSWEMVRALLAIRRRWCLTEPTRPLVAVPQPLARRAA